MKLGIIRCQQTEDYCPRTTDFKMIQVAKRMKDMISQDLGDRIKILNYTH